MNAAAVNMDFKINKRQLINGYINNDSVRNTDIEQSAEVIAIPTNKVHKGKRDPLLKRQFSTNFFQTSNEDLASNTIAHCCAFLAHTSILSQFSNAIVRL